MSYTANTFFRKIFRARSFVQVITSAVALVSISAVSANASTLILEEIGQRRAVGNPLYVTAPMGDENRAFVVGQRGEIFIYNTATDTFSDEPFLTVPNLGGGFEQGLLGVAFAPDYESSGRFYVSYVDAAGQHQVDEYTRSLDPNFADLSSRRNIITVEHPDDGLEAHYGGWIGFSPTDGQLYITTGDSDGFTDASQNNDNLLGSILRIDPCSAQCDVAGRNYNIPSDNPLVNGAGLDEIWANGLRNPFRAGFDSETGALFIGDVGEDAIEEINLGVAGANYGWVAFEGSQEFMPDLVDVDEADVTFALYEYLHGEGDFEGFSVTGGGVYRGPIEELDGFYFFADFVTNRIWSFEFDLDDMSISNLIQYDIDLGDLPASALSFISSIGFDGLGNLYVTTLFGDSNRVFRLTGAILDAEVPLPAAGLLMVAGVGLLFGKTKRKSKQ